MSNGNWSTRLTPLALAALIGGLLVYAYFDEVLKVPDQSPSQEQSTDRYTERAQNRISIECASLDAIAASKCENEIIQSAEESRRSQSDLQQQSDMARWAFWMMVASFFSVFVTAIGIVYIRMTLDQTVSANKAANRAVDVTRDIGEAQVRAYVGLQKVSIGGPQKPDVMIEIKNTGLTPAHDLRMWAGAHLANFPLNVELPEPKDITLSNFGAVAPGSNHSFPLPVERPFTAPEISALQAGEIALFLHGEIRYWDVFRKEERINKFRLFYGGDAGINAGGLFSVHEEGNEAN